MSQPDKSTTVYYLQMQDPQHLRAKEAPGGLDISLVNPPSFELNRDLYKDVGGVWAWTDRLVWSDQEWRNYVNRPEVQTWTVSVDGRLAGYFELEFQGPCDVEIVYFGLLEEFIGRGLGGAALSSAVRQAWSFGQVKRVWLHTCTDDHPVALDNYLNRGFELYDTKVE